MPGFTFAVPDGLFFGAGDGTRTRDIYLGKVVLYQLSYSRIMEASSRYNEMISPAYSKYLLALTYFRRESPPNYHRRWCA